MNASSHFRYQYKRETDRCERGSGGAAIGYTARPVETHGEPLKAKSSLLGYTYRFKRLESRITREATAMFQLGRLMVGTLIRHGSRC